MSAVVLYPGRIDLAGPVRSQQLVVERRVRGRNTGDMTARAAFTVSNSRVARVSAAGVVEAVGPGRATVTARVGRALATAVVSVPATPASGWSFRRHVIPILTRAGCNSGACHGAAAGKGGFRLTLRGYDPAADYVVLTRQALARRVSLPRPAESLVLQKPTMAVSHGGGLRFRVGSPDYRILLAWIAAGAPAPSETEAAITALEVLPQGATLRPGDLQRVIVRARFGDGRVEDVTRWAKFGTTDNSVASVAEDGQVRVQGTGEAAITVWHLARVAFATMTVPRPGTQDVRPPPARNFIDERVQQKLVELGIPASGPCSDSEFIRRVYLDAAGILPGPAEVRTFVRSESPGKRSELIAAVMKRPEFIDYWTYRWSDLLLVSSRKLPAAAMLAYSDWIRRSVAASKPWDQFAREIVTATGSNLDNGAANFYVLHKSPIDLTETMSQAFLGMSITCARCHNHPLEKWTQNDYYGMANLFSRVALKDGDRKDETLVFPAETGNIAHPRLGVPLPPRPLEGERMSLEAAGDRRVGFARWLTAASNPYFARAIVNRVWRNFMGRGLVEAEDDLRLTNPPSNEPLMAALAEDLTRSGYDLQRLMRLIMESDAYQRAPAPRDPRAADDRFYSHYIVRRLPAEVILDCVSEVTGAPTEFPGYPRGTRALQLPNSLVPSYFLTAFGRPERVQTCSCERQQEPSVAQALHLSNGDTINEKLRAAGGACERLARSSLAAWELVAEVFWLCLGRPPSPPELDRVLPLLNDIGPGDAAGRREAVEDLFWSLLTSREFLFNH